MNQICKWTIPVDNNWHPIGGGVVLHADCQWGPATVQVWTTEPEGDRQIQEPSMNDFNRDQMHQAIEQRVFYRKWDHLISKEMIREMADAALIVAHYQHRTNSGPMSAQIRSLADRNEGLVRSNNDLREKKKWYAKKATTMENQRNLARNRLKASKGELGADELLALGFRKVIEEAINDE